MWSLIFLSYVLFFGVGCRTVPYVHQALDTPDWFNGDWACGPTSSVMALAGFHRLPRHPLNISKPYLHSNDFGWYVPSVYTAYGHTFNREQKDASGKPAWGAYGTCTDGGEAWAWRMQEYVESHQLHAKFYSSASFDVIDAAVKRGHMIILSTRLTPAGHIILVYDTSPNSTLTVNDPWGNGMSL